MGHTNSTANLSLPQFIGTDKPTWLGDVNGAFSAIDSKVGTIDADIAATDAKADTAISDAAAAVTTATNANNTAGTASTTATQANNIANNALTVANNADGHTNQLEMKVGLLADLTTTDKTSIVNAINEVNGAIGAPSASQVSYDNTGSGLTATDVQNAIDELAGGSSGIRTVLWANPNASVDFSAQSVVLSEALTNFDEGVIYYANSKSALFGFRQLILDPTASASAICACQFVGSGSNVYSRLFTYTDATHIAVADGAQSSVPGTPANDVLIPVKIVGIKY